MSEDQLTAEIHWIHVFKDMVFSGDIAKLGPYATIVYLVIKTYSSAAGQSFPSAELIAKHAGISERQVLRQLGVLEEHGYLAKAKVGRHNVYQLREKVHLRNDAGETTAVASWDYAPVGVKEAVAELKRVLVTGEFAGAKIVNIENLQININKDVDMALNVQTMTGTEIDKRIEQLKKSYQQKKQKGD